jgi:hypothetical protein
MQEVIMEGGERRIISTYGGEATRAGVRRNPKQGLNADSVM